MMKICKFFSVILLFIAFNAYAAGINISLDKTVMTEGDTLLLTIEYAGNNDKKPDLSSLQNDFTIVSTSSSQQINIINGNVRQSKKWTFGLRPLRTGKIVIYPLRIDDAVSNSVEVEVKELTDVAFVPNKQDNSNSSYFKIEQIQHTESPYVQQQITIFVNVYDSVGLQDGGILIDEKSKNDWIVIPLVEKPIVRQDVIDNKHMNIVTYVFAAFPQKSGNLSEPQFSFDGYYVKNSQFNFPNFNDDITMFGVDFHNIFGQREPVRMKTEAKNINVQPVPTSYTGQHWLPLSNLKLEATWNLKKGFIVGEAVTRSITITAEGMTESMLPQLSFPEAEGFKQYPEKPEVTEQIDKNGNIITIAQINNVYIPSKSGNLTIPEIKLDWFDIKTNKQETATIAAENVIVLPNPILEAQSENNVKEEALDKPQPNVIVEENNSFVENPANSETSQNTLFAFIKEFYIIILGIFILFFILCGLIVSQKNKHFYRNAIIKNIRHHDYKKAKESVLLWAKYKFYPEDIANFNDISRVVKDKDFTDCLSELNKILYADNVEFFDNAKFIEILKKVDKIKTKVVNNIETLPNLYD